MKIGYARVSTGEQNLDLQVDALRAGGCVEVFIDQGVSGASVKRKGLDQALGAVMRPGGVLVVWKLDRLGRSLSFLLELMEDLGRREAGFVSLTDPIDTTSAQGRLIFNIMASLAEFERSLIGERTKAGMKAQTRRGKHVGRPRALNSGQIEKARDDIVSGRDTISSAAAHIGVHPRTLSRALRQLPP